MIQLLQSFAARLASMLVSFPRPLRQGIAVLLDLSLCLVATWLALYLRVGTWTLFSGPALFVAGITMFVWLLLALRLSIYQSIVRFSGGRTLLTLGTACVMLGIVLAAVLLPLRLPGIPRTVAAILPLVLFVLLASSRSLAGLLLVDMLHLIRRQEPPRRVLIYGAGAAGTQIAAALRREQGIIVAGFVDDDPRIDMHRIDGMTIWHTRRLTDVLLSQQIDEVVLALPSASRGRKRQIIDDLQAYSVRVRSLPSMGNIIAGAVSVSDIRDVQVEELLGRDPVAPNNALLGKTLSGKRVVVTGAGGSIGSELCRQIIRSDPAQLILVEQSEYGLYAIEGELRQLAQAAGVATHIVTELANVADAATVERLFRRWRPETVYHAAAYKHVPLVEANPIAGIRNNVLGTLHVCMAAEAIGVETMILVSTDKAVRPTNIMGATKRICELILQARAAEQTGTTFTMVRFGNVLGSSGSVVPRFKAQIAAGGPITLTDRRITRYFMTIPEAAQLVIQAGGMARGGDVFVLDMGEPIRILELAETMVRLSGLTVRDENNPEGDIAIVEVGLRDGEKLYEELLIGENPERTAHERIVRAHEAMIAWRELEQAIARIEKATGDGDVAAAMTILKALVPEYQPESAARPAS